MTGWKSVLKADPTDWLLQESDPGVRRLALTELSGRSASDPEVKAAGRAAMESGLIPKILSVQRPAGCWEAPDRFYMAKYRGTVWQLIILAQLGADGRDERIRKGCEFILANSQDREGGGFAYYGRSRKDGGRPSAVIPCLTGNMVWSLVRLGRLDDPRVARGIDWLVRVQRYDDGETRAPKGPPYDRYPQCWGKHTCHMGAVKALKALAAVPEARRTAEVKAAIERGAEYFLIHHIHKKSHDLKTVSRPGWLRLSFPWMYQSDILEILVLLTGLGYRDERMREAVDALLAKQDAGGAWTLENTFNGRFVTNIETKGRPSKWVTAHALIALKRYFGGARF